MFRHLGHRPGRAALTLAAALAAVLTAAFVSQASRTSKHAAPAAVAAKSVTAPTSGPTVPAPSVVAQATIAPNHEPATDPAPSGMPSRAAGMVVGIDPETGRVGMPSAADRAAIQRGALASPSVDRSDVGLQVIHKPDGSKMVDLQGRFQEYAIVKIGPDGKKTQSCVQGPEVDAALKGDAPAPGADASRPAASDPAASDAAPTSDAAPPTER